jgi:hypothetical protein
MPNGLLDYLFGDRPKVEARVGGVIGMPPAGPDGGSVNAPPPEIDPFTLEYMPPEMYQFAGRLLEEAGGNLVDFNTYPLDMRKDLFRRFNDDNPKAFRRQPGMGI